MIIIQSGNGPLQWYFSSIMVISTDSSPHFLAIRANCAHPESSAPACAGGGFPRIIRIVPPGNINPPSEARKEDKKRGGQKPRSPIRNSNNTQSISNLTRPSRVKRFDMSEERAIPTWTALVSNFSVTRLLRWQQRWRCRILAG